MDLDELVFHPWSVQGPRKVPTFVGGSVRTDGLLKLSALAFGGRTAVQSQPRSRASRAAAVRLGAPSLRMASDR